MNFNQSGSFNSYILSVIIRRDTCGTNVRGNIQMLSERTNVRTFEHSLHHYVSTHQSVRHAHAQHSNNCDTKINYFIFSRHKIIYCNRNFDKIIYFILFIAIILSKIIFLASLLMSFTSIRVRIF